MTDADFEDLWKLIEMHQSASNSAVRYALKQEIRGELENLATQVAAERIADVREDCKQHMIAFLNGEDWEQPT